MTLEQALTELKQWKKVKRKSWKIGDENTPDYIEISPSRGTYTIRSTRQIDGGIGIASEEYKLTADDIFYDFWEIVEENPFDGVKCDGLTVKIKANFTEYTQAIDKLKRRLEDLQEAAEELDGMKIDFTIGFNK